MYADRQGASLVVRGSGRFTSLFGSDHRAHQFRDIFAPLEGDTLYLNKFNHYEFAKQRAVYPIR